MATVLGWRFAVAAVVLFLILVVRRAPLLPAPGERLRAFLLGAVGYMGESTLFFMGLERGTAAAVSLLFYTYPAMVMVAEIALRWESAKRKSFVALALSAAGSVLVVASGSNVSISKGGVFFAFASAVAVTVYLIASARLVKRTGAITTGAWTAMGAAIAFGVRGLAAGSIHAPGSHVPALVGNGVATSAAFALLFASLFRLGATKTSVIMTLEAFFAIALAAVFLGEGLRPLQAVGGVAILAATALIAVSRRQRYESSPDIAPASAGRPRK